MFEKKPSWKFGCTPRQSKLKDAVLISFAISVGSIFVKFVVTMLSIGHDSGPWLSFIRLCCRLSLLPSLESMRANRSVNPLTARGRSGLLEYKQFRKWASLARCLFMVSRYHEESSFLQGVQKGPSFPSILVIPAEWCCAMTFSTFLSCCRFPRSAFLDLSGGVSKKIIT